MPDRDEFAHIDARSSEEDHPCATEGFDRSRAHERLSPYLNQAATILVHKPDRKRLGLERRYKTKVQVTENLLPGAGL